MKKVKLETVCLFYYILSDIDYLSKNIHKYADVTEKLKSTPAKICCSLDHLFGPMKINYTIKGKPNDLEKALTVLFDSSCGLPDFIIKDDCSKKGYRTVEQLINKYGKELKLQYWPPNLCERKVV